MKKDWVNGICVAAVIGAILLLGYYIGLATATRRFCSADPYNAHCVVTSIAYDYED